MAIDPVQLSFDGYNLQNDTIITSDIDGDEQAPPKGIGVFELPVLHGAKKTFEKVQARRITIAGLVKSATISGLVGKLEEMKELFTRQDKQLLITYPNGYPRLYSATVEGALEIQRDPWSLNIAPFKATFLCAEPWSVQTATSISGVYNITGPVASLALGISGTLDPQPQIWFHTTASGSRFSLTNTTTGDTIEVPTTFSGTGRSLLIDCYNYQVSIDGQPVTFKGTFPRFNPGVNNLLIQTYGTAGGAIDQSYQDPTTATYNTDIGGPSTFRAQSFVPAITKILAVELYLARYGSGPITSAYDLTVSIQADSAGKPSGTDLVSATIPAFNSTTPSWKRATFSSALTVTVGTTYWIVIKALSAPAFTYSIYYSSTSQYANGGAAWTTDGGVSWLTNTYDRLFRIYSDQGTPLSGRLIIGYNPRRW